MIFRDQMLTCARCGTHFVFTVTEQRRLASELGEENVEAPELCPSCRRSTRREEPREQSWTAREEPPSQPESAREEPTVQPSEPVAPAPQPQTVAADAFPLQEEGVQVKLIGTVKWFSREKGYGFITKADGQDIFFHRTALVDKRGVWPGENERVEFQIQDTPKGPEAINVSILPPE
jgi:CspA family cold shock protein